MEIRESLEAIIDAAIDAARADGSLELAEAPQAAPRRGQRRLGEHRRHAHREARSQEPPRDRPDHRGPHSRKRHDRLRGDRRPRLHQHPPVRCRAAGRGARGARGGRQLRSRHHSRGRALREPRVRVRQPHWPLPRGPWPLGVLGRCHGARHAPRRLRRVRGVLHQRPRQPDGRVRQLRERALPAAARPRCRNARGLLRRRLCEGHRPGHHRPRRRQVAFRLRRGARGGLPRDGLRHDA